MLGWCLNRPGLRDIALVQWATDQSGGDIASDAQRRWEDESVGGDSPQAHLPAHLRGADW